MFFRFKNIVSDYDEDRVCEGLIFADNFEEAIRKIVDYYGEDNLAKVSELAPFSSDSIIEFPSEDCYVLDKIEEEMIW